MLIDIHSHLLARIKQLNHLKFIVGVHSLGIHPWELEKINDQKDLSDCFNLIKNQMTSKILAIGECGIDRKRQTLINKLDWQIDLFSRHVEWAMVTKRPLIVHCVRSSSDILNVLKAKRYNGRILIHDFNDNDEVAKKFLNFDCYFSTGHRLFNEQSTINKVISLIPLERLFFETDDQTEFAIDSIYKKASDLLDKSIEFLEEQTMKNLLSFFSDLQDLSASDVVANLNQGSIS